MTRSASSGATATARRRCCRSSPAPGTRLRPRHPHLRSSVGYLHQSDDFAADATVRDVIVGGQTRPHLGGGRETPGRRRAPAWRARPGQRGRQPQRWGTAPRRAGRGAAGRPRRAGARRTDQPPRRRGHRLAGGSPRRAADQGAGGGQPRPLVSRRGVHAHVGGARRELSTPTKADTPRTCWPARNECGWPRAPRRAGATSCARNWRGCAGPARADVEAEVPHPGRQRTDRQRARAAGCSLPLQRFATARLGKDVFDLHRVSGLPSVRSCPPRSIPGSLRSCPPDDPGQAGLVDRARGADRARRRQRHRQDVGAETADRRTARRPRASSSAGLR